MIPKKDLSRAQKIIPLLAVIFLAIPNLHVIDLLPDFIACFLLVKYLSPLADSVPYFEEAFGSLRRLGWVNLLRIPAIFLIVFARSKNQADYDIIVLLALVFAIGELLLSLQAAHYLFDGLFYLGERTSCRSLIAPFAYTAEGTKRIDPESLRSLTALFVTVKATCSAIPEFLRLSSTSLSGTSLSTGGSSIYPIILLFALLLSLAVGLIWLSRMLAYRRAILAEADIFSAARELVPDAERPQLENKQKLRSLIGVFTVFTIASLFTLDITFSDLGNVDLIPQVFFAAVLCFGIRRLSPYVGDCRLPIAIGAVYGLLSLFTTGYTIFFSDTYGYDALLRSAEARAAYLPIKLLSLAEFVALFVFLLFLLRVMNRFVLRETGLSPESPRYGRTEASFHAALKRKNLTLFLSGVLMGATKCAQAFFLGTVKTVTVTEINGLEKTMVVPVMEGFSAIVLLTSLLYIFFSFYTYSDIKEELRLKLTDAKTE